MSGRFLKVVIMMVAVTAMTGELFAERPALKKLDGRVVGTVNFEGPRPKRKRIRLTQKNGQRSNCHALHEKGLLDENLIVGEKGELANVFVYVTEGLTKNSFPIPKKPAVLDQVNCMYRPRVLGVRVGQQLLMRNSDSLVHNVRSLSLENRPFNIAQPAKTPDRAKLFKKPEKAIAVQCDFHPWMKAYIFAIDHPFFAVTNAQGKFAITGLPAGEYTLVAWHEELGEQQTSVTVTNTGRIDARFSFKQKENGEALPDDLSAAGVSRTNTTSAPPAPKRRFVKMWKPEDFAGDLDDLAQHSPIRGREVFHAAACIKCHVIAGKGTKLGPDLTEVAKRYKVPKLLEQILKPSKEIHKDFQTHAFATTDGRTIVGLVIKEDAGAIHVLPNPLKPKQIEVIQKAEVVKRFKSQLSTMPEGLLMTFKKSELLDLLSFLLAGGKTKE